ncbi:hypothetical protein HG531_011620 [Fusarium graminearum]|nr:hypothetical protein HG531_011620 [Fusarium graminearum]
MFEELVHIQETAEALIILLLLRLVLLGLLSSGSITAGSGSSGSSRGVSIGVGDAVLELLNLGPADLGDNGNSKNLLVAVDEGVEDGRQGREVQSQRDGGNGGNGLRQSLEELLLTDVEDAGREGLALVVDLRDTHTVGEGRDVEHVEEGGLGGTDLGAGLNELEISGDFNGTTGNLGGDTESLEERGLSGLHSGVSSRNPDVGRGESTGTSGSSDLVGEDNIANLLEVLVGENETDVTLDVGKETLVLGGVSDEVFPLNFTHHGVLAHEDNTLVSESMSDLVHLLRADIVDLDDEDGGVLLEQALELVEVKRLVRLGPHIFLLD